MVKYVVINIINAVVAFVAVVVVFIFVVVFLAAIVSIVVTAAFNLLFLQCQLHKPKLKLLSLMLY